jgi:hypothetical protein
MNWFNGFSKNSQIQNFMQIRPMGAELFRADGRTGMTKLIVTLRSSVNGLKISIDILHKGINIRVC